MMDRERKKRCLLSFKGSEFCEGHMRFQVQLRFGILGFSQPLKSELERGMNGKMPRGRGKGCSRGMSNLEAIRHFRGRNASSQLAV